MFYSFLTAALGGGGGGGGSFHFVNGQAVTFFFQKCLCQLVTRNFYYTKK